MNLHHLFNLLVVFSQDLYLLAMAYGFGLAITAGVLRAFRLLPPKITVDQTTNVRYPLREEND